MRPLTSNLETGAMRRLVLTRHARAEAFASSDHDRRLTSAGIQDAHTLGSWLAGCGVVPDRALVSTATRTRQTWAALASTAGWAVAPEFDDVVYAGDTDTLIDEIRETPAAYPTVLLLGHNPAMAYLAQILADGDGDRAAEEAMIAGFSTSAAAVLEVAGPWSALGPGAGRLIGFHVGRA
ncbi:MAG: SixA phosphatase family protein [Nocardioides sp.]